MVIRTMRIAALPLASALMMLVFANSATGVTWYSSGDPLKVYDDGTARGKAYGNFYNSANTSAMSTAYYADLKSGGNAVRVETDFYWYGYNAIQCGSGSPTCFWLDVSKQTDETTSTSWQKHARARNLNFQASRARGRIDICEIQSWSNDPCSAKPLPTFDY